MSHAEERLLTAGAALGDLDAAECGARAAHFACTECARLEVELIDVLADLALLAPPRVLPASLLGDVRAAIRSADEGPVEVTRPATARTAPPPSMPTAGDVVRLEARARRRPLFAALALAAALAVVAAGLGTATARLSSDLRSAQDATARLQTEAAQESALMAALANPAHRTAALEAEPLAPAADALVVYVPGANESWLIADRMPPTPSGEAYQLWYADAGGAHPLASASWSGNGVMVMPVGIDLAHSTAVMLTLEAAGGATGAPGPQVVFGKL